MFKTTAEILNFPWRASTQYQAIAPELLPKRTEWNYSKELTIDDVKTWEEIYYQEGTIGIYASWDPYAEFYIVVYNLFTAGPNGIKIFQGQCAYKEVIHYAEKFGISLKLDKIWIDAENEWVYKD
jgi:hypothetical protein